MTETWKQLPSDDFYEVSDRGFIRNKHGLILKCQLVRGRRVVTLRAGKQVKMASLVLQTFVGPRPPDQQCRHLDSDKTNDKLSNLAWGTRQENLEDKVMHAKDVNSIDNYYMRVLYNLGFGATYIAEDLDMNVSTVRYQLGMYASYYQ